MKKTVLLTNDDGYFSPGLSQLAERLRTDYHLTIVAPDREQSAVSMGLTLHQPLRVVRHDERCWAVSGTPSDCVNLAIRQLMPSPPDFVLSGMNLGENLSEDLFYSGTVAASFTAYLYGLPTMAVSLVSQGQRYDQSNYDVMGGVDVTQRVLTVLVEQARKGLIYNLNIPYENSGSLRVTRIGRKRYVPDVEKRVDPRGRAYYWMGTGGPVYDEFPDTDVWAIRNRHISLSPFTFSFDEHGEVERLQEHFQ